MGVVADDDFVPDLFMRIVLIQPDDLRARRHDFTDGQLIEFKGAVNDLAFHLVERTGADTFLHQHTDFFFGYKHFLRWFEAKYA